MTQTYTVPARLAAPMASPPRAEALSCPFCQGRKRADEPSCRWESCEREASRLDLARLIRSHGVDARVLSNGMLVALAEWSDADGEHGCRWEPIAPNVDAVREWLGY